MQSIFYKFEPEILLAISDFEKEFGESVIWGQTLDFYPDLERASDENVPLVATLGVYLEIPGPTDETVVSGSIFIPPHLEIEQAYKAIFDSLVGLRKQRSTPPL